MELQIINPVKLRLLIIACACLTLAGCYYDKADKLYPYAVQCDTSNIRYSTVVMPIIRSNCLNRGCHNSGNPSGGYNFETYSVLVSTIPGDKLVNALKFTSGGSKNMPPTGQLSSCEIRKIEAWIRRGYQDN